MGMPRTLMYTTFTPTGTADGVDLADGTYMAIQGASTTARCRILEIIGAGQAVASNINALVLAGDSQIGVTLSKVGISDNPLDQSDSNITPAPTTFNTATTKPRRHSSIKLLNLSHNGFGGQVQWWPNPQGKAPTMLGNAAGAGEFSLSCVSGFTSVAMGLHMVYEPL